MNYAYTTGDFENVGGNFKTDTYGVTVYGSLLPVENLYIDAILGYARKDNSLDRNASANQGAGNVISGTAISDSDADEFTAGISGGYDFAYQSFTYGPHLAVNYVRTEVGEFRESGNSGLELAFDSQTFDSLTASVGGHASTAISTSFGVLLPQISAEYIHEFANDQQTLTARFVQGLNAGRLRFVNDSPDRDYFGVGVGMVMVLPNGFSPYMNYRALLGDSIKTTQTATAGLRVKF